MFPDSCNHKYCCINYSRIHVILHVFKFFHGINPQSRNAGSKGACVWHLGRFYQIVFRNVMVLPLLPPLFSQNAELWLNDFGALISGPEKTGYRCSPLCLFFGFLETLLPSVSFFTFIDPTQMHRKPLSLLGSHLPSSHCFSLLNFYGGYRLSSVWNSCLLLFAT